MSQELTWPPPPTTPDPRAEYDDFLADLIRAPVKKSLWTQPPLSRRRLVQALRRHTGMQLRPCRDVVDSFCDRHAIFPKPSGFRAWGIRLFSNVVTVLGMLQVLLSLVLMLLHRHIHTYSDYSALFDLIFHIQIPLIGLMALACAVFGVAATVCTRIARQEAEKARGKLS